MSNNQLQSGLSMKINEDEIEITTMEDDLSDLDGTVTEKKPITKITTVVPAKEASHGFSLFGGNADKSPVKPSVAPKSASPFLTDTPPVATAPSPTQTVGTAPAKPATMAPPIEKKRPTFSIFGGNKAQKFSSGMVAPIKSGVIPQDLPIKSPTNELKPASVVAAMPVQKENKVSSFFGGGKVKAVAPPATINGMGAATREDLKSKTNSRSPELAKPVASKKEGHWYSFFGGNKEKKDALDKKVLKPNPPVVSSIKNTPSAFSATYYPATPATSSVPPYSSSDMKPLQNVNIRDTSAKTAPAPANLMPKVGEKEKIKVEVSEKKTIKMGLDWGMITVVAIVLVIIVAGAGGGYYYWATRRPVAQPIVVTQPIIEKQPRITVPDSKFSEELPNYLNIDVEASNMESIKELLVKKAQEVNEAGLKKPVEFLVRDQNNNPIAFTRFAYIFQLNLSANVLINMEEDFSLFFYNDNGLMHLGLAVELLDIEEAMVGLTKEEKTIVQSFMPIFLDKVIVSEGVKFSSGKYGEQATRYANLNADNSVSFDYAIIGKKWVMGTSMLTVRAIMDKIAAEKALAPVTSTAPAVSTPIENQATPITTGTLNNATDCPEGADCL